MSTQTRLDAYLAAEANILKAQEVRGGDRTFRMAELEEVRKAIKELQTQLGRETLTPGLRFSHANLSGRH
jgi:hypothetical protein